ncbi:YceI family protein [Novosphingobium sp.]|uniref:YceI family protein n=1 Tax=Novosphingobium sp. TaxID=1874826 RepID=UPI0032B783A6
MLRVATAVLLLLATAAAGPAYRYQLDAAGSEVNAKVGFLGLASKTARFPRMSGAIRLSPDRLEAIDLDVLLDGRAITADDRLTQERLRGPQFFDVERHPAIGFNGQRMTMTGTTTALVDGALTARGTTRPVRLAVAFDRPPAQASGRDPIGFIATTTIDRYQFGMTAYSLVVGRKVTITIKARMVPG